jgi:hypothetical protein
LVKRSKEELVMSLRTIASIAGSVIIAIACTTTVSIDAFAAPAGMNRLHHHHHHHHGNTVHPSGQVRLGPTGNAGASQAR